MRKSRNNISNWLKEHGDPEIDKLVENEIIKVTTKQNKIKLLESSGIEIPSDLDEHSLDKIIKELWK